MSTNNIAKNQIKQLNDMNINELKPSNYNDDVTSISELKKIMANFIKEREWEKYHDPKNLSMSIAIEASELMELFQWLKNEETLQINPSLPIYEEICDELADIILYCLSLANVLKIDISNVIAKKMLKNISKYPKEKFKGNYKKPKSHNS